MKEDTQKVQRHCIAEVISTMKIFGKKIMSLDKNLIREYDSSGILFRFVFFVVNGVGFELT